MKVIVAPDSFKGSASALEVAEAMKRGILKANPNGDVVLVPMADGGEGFVEAMAKALDGTKITIDSTDPLARPIRASYAIVDENTAIIEMAAASGLTLLQEQERNPLHASTYGTGLLIRDALDRGCHTIYIGLGGSATNDGGIGMAEALGYKFYNDQGEQIDIVNRGMEPIARIDSSGRDPRLDEVQVIAACDVKTRLYGEEGASAVFGPQKGATESMIQVLDGILQGLAHTIERDLNFDVHTLEGGGAAGGLGAGLAAFCGAQLQNGIKLVMDACRFETHVADAMLVLTGEGKTDEQTLMGKVPVGIGEVASRYGVPVICLSGSVAGDFEPLRQAGIQALFSIVPGPCTLEEAIQNAPLWIEQRTYEIMSVWMTAISKK